MYNLLFIVILGSLIGGCAPSANFSQAGVSEGQRNQDFAECEMMASAAAHGDPFKEPMFLIKCMKLRGYK